MFKHLLKSTINFLGINLNEITAKISRFSLFWAMKENRFGDLIAKLRLIEPDISRQEVRESMAFNEFSEFKRRLLQAFQCNLLLLALEDFKPGKLSVVDIGDSAGTHMLYLKVLAGEKFDLDTLSVNLDPRAIEKIKARGQKALLCRAEELDLTNQKIDIFTSFEMIEHLHNPAIFFRRLAKKTSCDKMVITVPYLKRSRMGLYHTRVKPNTAIYAEDEHIFELCPEDWRLLLLHSGWKVKYDRIYLQYPRRVPLIGSFFSWYWRQLDFEGFWGAILEKDTSVSDYYRDWEE